MITTGVIKKINVSGGKHKNNKVIAEVSLFKSPGDTNTDAYNCECNCSVPGGMYSPYNVGDKVYIGFLNGKKTNPIILGKIYQGLEDESRAFAYFNSLKVSDQVNLPENTLLGDLKVTDIKNLDKKIDNLNVIANRFPNPPIVDGEYNLRCSVSGNEGTTINSKFISGTPGVKKSIRQSIQTKCGNTVVKNQIIKNGNFADTSENWYNSGVSKAIANNTITFTINQDVGGGASIYVENDYTPTPGHKFLMSYKAKVSRVGINLGYGIGGTYKTTQFFPTDTNWHVYCEIDTFTSNDVYKYFYIGNCSIGDEIQFRDYQIIDLTQWFGSNDNIPQDLLNNPSHFSWYYNGDLSYNTGTLINATGRYLECGQSRNIWDEEWEVLYTNFVFSKNYIRVFPNTTYYYKNASEPTSTLYYYDKDKTLISQVNFATNNSFTTPSGCYYIKFSYQGTTYNHDITISLYYTPEQGGEGYDKYYPYIAPKVIDTGSEILRSAGSIYDYKTSDGTITRRVGRVDLGTLTWNYGDAFATGAMVFYAILDENYKAYGESTIPNAICPKYRANSANYISQQYNSDKTFSIFNGWGIPRLVIVDTSYTDAATFKSAMSGVYLYYELETPTTEQGTSFQEYITINDYSYMLWKDANDNLANIPQGCDIFYLQKEGGEIRYYWALVN